MSANKKPLGTKAYGSIPHLPQSRLGSGDYHCHQGQTDICTVKARPNDIVIVTEKLDGSNVAIAKVNGEIVALGRAGYLAETSPYEQHKRFAGFVRSGRDYYSSILKEGQSLHGEWLALAHGTLYENVDKPFVAFDLKQNGKRLPYARLLDLGCTVLKPLYYGRSVSVETAMEVVSSYPLYKCEQPEGLVYRVETDGEFNFMAKYVRHDKIDGEYLSKEIWLWEAQS